MKTRAGRKSRRKRKHLSCLGVDRADAFTEDLRGSRRPVRNEHRLEQRGRQWVVC